MMRTCSLRIRMLLLALATFFTATCGRNDGAASTRLTIIGSGNLYGQIDPCDCRPYVLGGLARRATAVERLSSKNKPLLIVDAGNSYFISPQIASSDAHARQVRARAMATGLDRLGLEAANVGAYDLAAGLGFLRSLADTAAYLHLSANLADESGETLFPTYTRFEKGRLKIGVVGAASPAVEGKGYRWLPLRPALEQAVARVHPEADLVVLLFQGRPQDLDTIRTSGLPIDLILYSPTDPGGRFVEGRVPVVDMGSLGKVLSTVTVNISAVGQPLADLDGLHRTLQLVERQLSRLELGKPEGVTLREHYSDRPAMLERIDRLQTARDEAQRKLDESANTLKRERITLDRSLRDDPELAKLVEEALEEAAGLAEEATPQ